MISKLTLSLELIRSILLYTISMLLLQVSSPLFSQVVIKMASLAALACPRLGPALVGSTSYV